MLELYYTGADTFLGEQLSSNLSLGGFISCSLIPNEFSGNLFGSLSKSLINLNKNQLRVIALKNATGVDITGLTVHFDYPLDSKSQPKNLADYEVGWQAVKVDVECGDLSLEKIVSEFASPFGKANFQSAEGLSNALSLPNLPNNNYIGLYIRRKPNTSAINGLTREECLEVLSGEIMLDTEENIQLVFNWN